MQMKSVDSVLSDPPFPLNQDSEIVQWEACTAWTGQKFIPSVFSLDGYQERLEKDPHPATENLMEVT